jgi:magnesium transporter
MKAFYKSLNGIIPCVSWEPSCWMHVECPTEEEKKQIIEEFEVPLSYLNDIEDIDERPRIELEDGWFLIVLRIPYLSDDPKLPYSTAPLGLIFNDHFFMSVCNVNTEMIQDFILYSNRKNKSFTLNFDLVLRLMLSSSVWFLKYLKQINSQIKIAESKLEKSIKNEDLQRLLEMEKCLVYFATSLKGNDILNNRLRNLKQFKEILDEDIEELFEDVEIEVKQAQETTKIYSDILNGMMDSYASVVANNLNIILKQLTSISIILMIPTLIASLYGMNVPNFFENNHFAFLFIIIICAIFSIGGIMLFKRRNWF